MILMGRMVHFATFEKFIQASSGSAAMKRQVIDLVRALRQGDLIDSFVLGLMLSEASRKLPPERLRDFEATIALTRDLNNVPIVQIEGQPVS